MKGIQHFNYTSQLEQIVMPEYGRNVQQLVHHARTIEDKNERQQFVEEIVNLILRLYPQSKTVEDYRDKLWTHIFKIANYDLEALPPNGEIPTREHDQIRPERVPYPRKDTRFKHYGNHVQLLIKKAMEMEEGPVLDGFVQTIGAYMKLAYRTWNKEHYVSDDIIKNDLVMLSGGKLTLEDTSSIDVYATIGTGSKRRPTSSREVQGGNYNNNNNTGRGNSSMGRNSKDSGRPVIRKRK